MDNRIKMMELFFEEIMDEIIEDAEIMEKAYELEHSVKGTLDVPAISEDAKPPLID
jgi:hypothetical protein